MKQYELELEQKITVPPTCEECSLSQTSPESSAESTTIQETPAKRVGRPEIPFEDASERSKRRKTTKLRKATALELAYAVQMKLRTEGDHDRSSAVKQCFFPENVAAGVKSTALHVKYSKNEGLALLLDLQLSKLQWKQLRISAKNQGIDLYPSYEEVVEAKKECLPSFIEVSESKVRVLLQEALDVTASRLTSLQSELIIAQSCTELVLVSKWGFDGSTGHAE